MGGVRTHVHKVKPRIDERVRYGRKDIEPYDLDNCYPNTTKKLVEQSHNTYSCIKLKSQFLFGSGFKLNGDIQVNEKENINDILQKVCYDYSVFKSAALYVGIDAVGNASVIKHIPFEYVRREKDTKDYVVYNNWDGSKGAIKPQDYIYLKRYDSNYKTEKNKYSGQLYLISHSNNTYTKSAIDPIVELVLTDYLLAVKKNKRVENEFSLKQVFLVPEQNRTPIYDENNNILGYKEDTLQDQLNEFIGEEGAELMALETTDMENPPFKAIPINASSKENNEYEEESTRNQIISFFNQPLSLRSVPKSGVLFSNEQIREAYIYYNNVTEMDRRFLERKMNRLFDSIGIVTDEIMIKEFNFFGSQQEGGKDVN